MKQQETRKPSVPKSKTKVAGTNKPKCTPTEPTTSQSKKLQQKKCHMPQTEKEKKKTAVTKAAEEHKI